MNQDVRVEVSGATAAYSLSNVAALILATVMGRRHPKSLCGFMAGLSLANAEAASDELVALLGDEANPEIQSVGRMAAANVLIGLGDHHEIAEGTYRTSAGVTLSLDLTGALTLAIALESLDAIYTDRALDILKSLRDGVYAFSDEQLLSMAENEDHAEVIKAAIAKDRESIANSK